MSDQLEPELERVAQMLADAGPLPDAPATLRERALAIPDGGPVAAAELVEAAPRRQRRRPRALALAGVAAVVAAIAIVPAVVLTTRGGDVGQNIELAAASVRAEGRRQRARRGTRRRQRDDRAEGLEDAAPGRGARLRGLARQDRRPPRARECSGSAPTARPRSRTSCREVS